MLADFQICISVPSSQVRSSYWMIPAIIEIHMLTKKFGYQKWMSLISFISTEKLQTQAELCNIEISFLNFFESFRPYWKFLIINSNILPLTRIITTFVSKILWHRVGQDSAYRIMFTS